MSPTRYEETAAHLRQRIEEGDYPPGSKIPSVRTLAAIYDVSDATIRAALRVLEAEGLVKTVSKSGIVVRERSGRRRLTRSSQISHDGKMYRFPAAAEQGEPWEAHGDPLASTEPVPADVAAVLGIEPGTPTARRRRVMSPQGEEPWDVIDSWIPPRIVAEAPQAAEPVTGTGGYLARIEEAGHGPLSWEETARADMPSREEADLLGISPYMPVMRILRTAISARDGLPAECSSYVIPCDRIEIHSTLTRGPSARWPVSYS
ncbi:GntR family transcriptional regulator [Streptomyces virginiae]|uniref:GntR family transcriptional regulator n=1 Tax=Streptomyces virginiae TaxID=1961 RepID=A0ABZ1TSC7_STRVG|nr:GntR family transcriptional regulator [Streptomyces virginiae]